MSEARAIGAAEANAVGAADGGSAIIARARLLRILSNAEDGR